MEFGETEVLRSEGSCRLLKIGCRGGKVSYGVLGGDKSTNHYDDYEDALDDFNLRWMQEEHGE